MRNATDRNVPLHAAEAPRRSVATPGGTATTADQRRRLEIATLRAFVETSSDAMFGLDLSEHIVSWNRSAERIFGYDTSEVLGRLVVMLFPAHLPRPARDGHRRGRAGDRVDHVEIEMQRKDGMPIPVSPLGQPGLRAATARSTA